MNIQAGVSAVRYDVAGNISHCEMCDDSVSHEEEDINAVRTIRVRIQGLTWNNDASAIYKAVYDGKVPDWMPEAVRGRFSVVGPTSESRVHGRGDILSCIGKFTSHPKFGFQFALSCAPAIALTESVAAFQAWLDKLPNIGPVRSRELLKAFDGYTINGLERILHIVEHEPQQLTVINGITTERAIEIKEAFLKEKGYFNFRMFAVSLGLQESVIAQALERWGDEAETELRDNLYALLELEDIGFKTVDKIARESLNTDLRDIKRLAAGIVHILDLNASEGHSYIEEKELLCSTGGITSSVVTNAVREFGLSDTELQSALALVDKPYTKIRRKKEVLCPPLVKIEQSRIYHYEHWEAECVITSQLCAAVQTVPKKLTIPNNLWNDFKPSEQQVKFIDTVNASNVVVLSGQPGTGKSAITRKLIEVLDHNKLTYRLLAPTGKATIRLAELTNRDASTIHRAVLAGGSTLDGDTNFVEDVIIIDEVSMVGLSLLAKLVVKVPSSKRLVFIGDVNQLPSVDVGRVLADLIDSNVIPIVMLTEIFRQKPLAEKNSDGSEIEQVIPHVCKDIIEGRMPQFSTKGNVRLLVNELSEDIASIVTQAATDWMPNKYGYSTQILSPQQGEQGKKNFAAGVKGLNLAVQELLNGENITIQQHIGNGYVLRKGDTVIHKVNNYDLGRDGVMNGEIGVCERVELAPFIPENNVQCSTKKSGRGSAGDAGCKDCELRSFDDKIRLCPTCLKLRRNTICVINYGDRKVGYDKKILRQLQLAYAITVHSYQGSQGEAIVVPLDTAHSFSLTRRLLYTAASRAEKRLVFVGTEKALKNAINNTRDEKRRSTLKQRITGEI